MELYGKKWNKLGLSSYWALRGAEVRGLNDEIGMKGESEMIAEVDRVTNLCPNFVSAE